MQYTSTRSDDIQTDFENILLTGLAPDGGLFMPNSWPFFSVDEQKAMATLPYAEFTAAIFRQYLGDQYAEKYGIAAIERACAKFDSPEIAPLVKLSHNQYLLELFHGPSFAFKDIAMTVLAQFIPKALQTHHQHGLIIGATSGDTGAATIQAFDRNSAIDVIMLFPFNGVSEIQRKQMTCFAGENIYPIAVQADFDACQTLAKQCLMRNSEFPKRQALAVNSINWCRIMAQSIYYARSSLLLNERLASQQQPIDFVVPTGNFGNIFAGYVAKKMGFPIGRLTIASNSNDVVPRALETGTYGRRTTARTHSPSMDIQVSSNFERLIFEALERDSRATRALMENFERDGQVEIPKSALSKIRANFQAERASEAETLAAIQRLYQETGRILDPHTAVGYAVCQKLPSDNPTIVLATAHPGKFPGAVHEAIGITPKLPRKYTGPERFTVIEPDIAALMAFITDTSITDTSIHDIEK